MNVLWGIWAQSRMAAGRRGSQLVVNPSMSLRVRCVARPCIARACRVLVTKTRSGVCLLSERVSFGVPG